MTPVSFSIRGIQTTRRVWIFAINCVMFCGDSWRTCTHTISSPVQSQADFPSGSRTVWEVFLKPPFHDRPWESPSLCWEIAYYTPHLGQTGGFNSFFTRLRRPWMPKFKFSRFSKCPWSMAPHLCRWAPRHSGPGLRILNCSAHSLTLLRNCSNPEFLVVFSKCIDSLAMFPEMEIGFIEKENTHLL